MNDKVENVRSSSTLPRTRTAATLASLMYSDKPWRSMLLFSTTRHSFVRGLIVLMSSSMIFLAFDSIMQMKSDSCSSSLRTSNRVACFFLGMSWALGGATRKGVRNLGEKKYRVLKKEIKVEHILRISLEYSRIFLI
jgi:hypothetical protein